MKKITIEEAIKRIRNLKRNLKRSQIEVIELEDISQKFSIAILGYNSDLTKYGFRQFLENNVEQIEKIDRNKYIAHLKDGTRLQAIIRTGESRLMGSKFDQLILFDDNRWSIYQHRQREITDIKNITMSYSNVPEEFQILEYEDMR